MSVYFAQRDGLIKIGWSKSVPYRMISLRAKLIGAEPGERAREASLHKRFSHLRVHGEWFNPGEDLLEYIQTEAQEHKPDSDNVQTAIRLPESLLKSVDRIAENMSQPGMIITRVDVLRMAAFRGVAELESEQKL